MSDFDVIVVGTRCAGASLAMLLAREGYRVLNIDRAHFPSDTHSTHFFSPRNNLVQGPDVVLAAEATQPLAMVLHELTTNAAKHGALSSRGGQVSVCWERQSSCTSQGGLALEWRETGGPPILVPGPSGYGASVIRDLIPYELDGFVDYVLAPEGVRCRFEIPEKWLCSSVLR